MGHELYRTQIQIFKADKPLHRAIIAGQLEKVKEILDYDPGLVNSTCRLGGWTCTTFELALICHEDDKAAEFIKLFLTYKPELNFPGTNGDTELYHAIVAEREKCILILLKAGSDPNHKIQNRYDGDIQVTPLMHSVFFMEMFFQNDSKITPIHIRIFKLLIEHGLDPSVISPSYSPFSLLHRLLMLDNVTAEVFSIFLGARHKIDIDLKTQSMNKDDELDGESLLHWAARTKKPDCVQLLLSKKANPNILNNKGLTPLDSCLLSDPFAVDVTKILLAHGAMPLSMKEIFTNFGALMPTVVEMGSVKLPEAEIFSSSYEDKQDAEFEQFKQAVDECYKDRLVVDLPALDEKQYQEIQTASNQNQLHLQGRSMKAFLSKRKQSCAYSELPKEGLANIAKHSQLSFQSSQKPKLAWDSYQFLRKQKLSWDLLHHFSSEKYFRDPKVYPRMQVEVLGTRLPAIDCRQARRPVVLHTTKTDPNILGPVLKSGAGFVNQEPYISCSVADETTPPAEMSHQENVSFPLHLLFQMPVSRLQFASHMDVGSGIGVFSNEVRFLDARNRTSMKLNWLQSDHQARSVSRDPLGYLPLPPYLLQLELEADPRYKKCFSGEATGFFSDDLMDTEFLSVDSLQRKTKSHYNEILVGLGTREDIDRPQLILKITKKMDKKEEKPEEQTKQQEGNEGEALGHEKKAKQDSKQDFRQEPKQDPKKNSTQNAVEQQKFQSSGFLSWLFCCCRSRRKVVPPPVVNKEDVSLLGLGIEEAWLNKFKSESAPKLDRNQLKSIRQSLKIMKDSGFPIFLYRTEFERQAEKVGYRDRAKQFLNRYVELRIRHFRYSKIAEMVGPVGDKSARELQQQIQAMEKEIVEFDLQYLFEYFNYTPQMDIAVETVVESVLRVSLIKAQEQLELTASAEWGPDKGQQSTRMIHQPKRPDHPTLQEAQRDTPKETPASIIMSYYRPHARFKSLAAGELER